MAAIDRRDASDVGAALAGTLASSSFVELRVAPSLDAIAAATILTRTLDARGTAFQARIATDASGDTIGIGQHDPDGEEPHVPAGAATETATELAESLGTDVPTWWAAVGTVLASDRPEADRSPGVGLPVDDPVDGLAHATLVQGSFSGDPERSRDFLDRLPDDDPSTLASAVVLDSVGETSQPAAERVVRPIETPNGPFATAAGTADVLDVLADVDPGLALAVLHGDGHSRDGALGTWRSTAARLHDVCRSWAPDHVEGLERVDAPDVHAPGALARMLRDEHDGSRTILVDGGERIGLASNTATTTSLAEVLEDHCNGITPRRDRRVTARPSADVATIETAIEEAIT